MTRATRLVLRPALLLHLLLLFSNAAAAQDRAALRVVSAGPTGEVAAIEEANEVRVVFSEPMAALGQVPLRLRPPFFRITPAVPGTFRWSGATVLIFTPAKRLPLATKYDVVIAAGAAALSGRTLAAPYRFSFTTPTARLVSTDWYRPDGRYDVAPVFILRFNQAIKPADVLPHVRASFQRHDFLPPVLPQPAQTRLRAIDPGALDAFAAKVQRARAAASATSALPLALAADWDKKRFKPSSDTVVLRAAAEVPPESWVRLVVDGQVPSPAGLAVPGLAQNYLVQVEQTFFVERTSCQRECDPDVNNQVEFRGPVKVDAFATALRATDVTDPRRERPLTKAKPRQRESWELDESTALSIEDAGFPGHPPAATLLLTLPADLKASDGQTLGYTWAGQIETLHQRAFTSFGDGHGVWEHGGGPQLPFYARNFQNVLQWATRIEPSQLMPTLTSLQAARFRLTPSGPGAPRRLTVTPNRIQSHALDLTRVLSPSGHGLVWTAIEEGLPIDRARAARTAENEPLKRASLVQVTNLGISVKDSPQNTLIWVTRLDNAAPVPAARVSIVQTDGRTAWTGTTGADGIAVAPEMRLRSPRNWTALAFVVIAEKDGDVAYTASDWNEGIMPWEFGSRFDLDEADPLLRGTVFTDRGVYKPGEEVHFKAILRSNAPGGIRLLPEGTAVAISVRDARDKVIDERTVKLTGWSTAEWTLTLPSDGTLGDYSIRAMVESDRAQPKTSEAGADDFDYLAWKRSVAGHFLVAAYRRPDFRVDVTLTGQTRLAGDPLNAVVSARYLFGAPMANRPAQWKLTRSPVFNAPSTISETFPADRWTFVGWDHAEMPERRPEVAADAKALAPNGQLALTLPTDAKAGLPYSYTLEGDVEDVSRQHIANRASLVVHPAPWYIGIKRIPLFNEQRDGLKTEVIAAGLDGRPVAGVPIQLTLTQIQWRSVRRSEGNGFYTWESERMDVPAGSWRITSAAEPVAFTTDLPSGGYFVLEARAEATEGRHTVTRESFYSLGSGYTAWQRYDHNRIELVADRRTYKPGDTARIMIQSPWERASALVTTEREGIRSHRQFTLTSTQQSIDIPIGEGDIPNVYVSVLLVKGRTAALPPASGEQAAQPERTLDVKVDDPADPGKPAFKLGYVQLSVEDAGKRLTVAVTANRTEFRPANDATVTLDVKDAQGRGAASEVTLWAVDYGVLSLTAYRTPDVLGSVYVRKALQVMTEDGRQKIISRRVITPKGDTDGGGGGAVAGDPRQDFRVLAFWIGSITTDARGGATVNVKLPESLTTYRIMAVAGDRSSRFGFGESEIRINKPVTLKAAFPRFLAVGDKASFGAVVTSQLRAAGAAAVTIESLDPQVLQFAATGPQTIEVPAGGSVEARFDAAGRTVGRARVRMSVRLNGETDAFEDVIPVEILVSPETVAAIGEAGEAAPTASEMLKTPAGVVASFGGLHLDLASTALVGLGEGARYLVEYPYGCAEQRGSRALALLLSADLGEAFKLPGIEPAQLKPAVQASLRELERFQCENGGFAYWPGACRSHSPYLTAYLLHVFKVAADLNYTSDVSMRERAYAYLVEQLAQKPPVNESWWPSYTAWQAFAVKVLVEGGRNQDANITRLYSYRERMPVFALAYLNDALVANGEGGGLRSADLRRRIGNAILPEAATAHVKELEDPYLDWYWSSNVRSTAIALRSLVAAGTPDAPYRGLVAWLLQARRNGRWGNTQENALALEALVSYYRRFEAVTPNFTATARLGTTPLATAQFQGRSTEARATDVPMAKLLAASAPGAEQPLTFTRTGTGTLFYSARLRYAVDRLFQQGLDNGFRVERSYAPYVEKGTRPATATYQAGDLVRVTLTLTLTKERRFVAVNDPLPAGFEPVETWFATSAASLVEAQSEDGQSDDWTSWWERGGFDHVERFDDRVRLFATRLGEGRHVFSYVARATTAGTFRTAPTHAEEMYAPEVFGRTATAVIEVRR